MCDYHLIKYLNLLTLKFNFLELKNSYSYTFVYALLYK